MIIGVKFGEMMPSPYGTLWEIFCKAEIVFLSYTIAFFPPISVPDDKAKIIVIINITIPIPDNEIPKTLLDIAIS